MTLLLWLHLASFWAAAALTLTLGAVAAWDVLTGRLHRLALDRLVLALLAVLVIAGAVGIAILLAGPGPPDPLHLVYGVAAPAVVAVARWLGRRPVPRRRAGWLAAGALALGGVLLCLWTTGG